MKSTRLLAAAMVSMVAAMGASSVAVMRTGFGAPSLKPPKTEAASRTAGSSRNGGRRGSNRANQRMALKKRNQQRHRKACRA
jgi:hypothetical protein